MNFITIHRETGLLLCKECKFALIPSRIETHFSINPHNLRPDIRTQIKNYISQSNNDNLVTYNSEIRSTIQRFLRSFDQNCFIPDLALYRDGLGCPYCSYISRSKRPIQKHLKESHDWENSRIRGRKKKSHENDPWEHNVPCQQFFKSEPGNQYFRVNSIGASPSRIPIRPRIEISKDRGSNSPEYDQDQDILGLLDPISQG